MNLTLESLLVSWLQVEGVAVPLFKGHSAKQQPQGDQTLTVFVPDGTRVVGPLYRPTISFIVATPPHDEDDPDASLGNHEATARTIRNLLEDPPESLKTAIDASGELYYRGGFMDEGGTASIEGGRWVTTIQFIAGISTEAAS